MAIFTLRNDDSGTTVDDVLRHEANSLPVNAWLAY